MSPIVIKHHFHYYHSLFLIDVVIPIILELMLSINPTTSASQEGGTIGTCH
jgi:hypothetical protein